MGCNVPLCLNWPLPDHEGRPPGRRRTKLFLAGALVLLLLGILLVGLYEKKPQPKGTAAVTVKQDSHPAVVQVRAATLKPPRGENVPYVLSLGQEVYVDVRAAGMWLRQRMGELGKPNLDPRAKVTLETVVFDPDTEKASSVEHGELKQEQQAINAERKRIEALPDGPDKENDSARLKDRETKLGKDADALLLERRNSAWRQAVKDWLESSCLVVNGRIFRDLNPQIAYGWNEYLDEVDYDHYDALRYKIVVTEANKPLWLELLGGAGLGRKPVSVSIAMVDVFDKGKEEIMPTDINPSYYSKEGTPEWQKVSLKASTDWLTWLLLDCFILLFLMFLYYAFATKVLRDLAPDGLWHLSLGRCQMAFWFFIITGSYIFLWIVTGDYKTLTTQELLILGISSATGIGAFLVTDTSDSTASKPRGSAVLTQEEMDLDSADKLQARIALEAQYQRTGGLTEAEARKSQLRLAELERRAAYYKAGWVCGLWRSLNDLISESNDGRPSFHRFQMIGWNLVFGVIFVRAVYYKLAMPEFSNDQLLLMGISNGTYLGFKWSVSRSENSDK